MNIQQLRSKTRLTLAGANRDPRQLTILFVGISLAATLLSVVLDLVTTAMMADAGGLDGLTKRTILSTVSAFFDFAVMVSLPFLTYGFTYATIRLARGEDTPNGSLLQGFRRIFPILGASFLQSLLYSIALILCMNIASTVWMFTPLGMDILENAETILATTDPEQMVAYVEMMIPVYILTGVLALPLCLFLFYRLRLLPYCLMDGNSPVRSLFSSFKLMHRRMLFFVKLDLHFWWYYLLQLLCAGLAWLDVGMTAMGIPLPGSQELWALVSYAISGIGQLLLAWYFQTEVAVTYAAAYDEFLHADPIPSKPKKQPESLPWDYE